MDSATSHHHDASDEHENGEAATAEALAALAAAPPSERALGSAVLLSEAPRPPRANLGNPPRSAQKKRDQARSGSERSE